MTILLSVAAVTGLEAQFNLRGEVYEKSSGEPMIGANVMIQGTTQGTITEFDGTFLLSVDTFPVTLLVSYTGFLPREVLVDSDEEKVIVNLDEDAIVLSTVEVTGSRVADKRRESPLTVESLDVLAIKETAAANFYEGLGSLKGVDLTTASLGFTIINTRGFNSTSPVRSLQIIDGVDNQSPGLNFSLGNFLGAPELDILKVDLIQGASSAFYGPNAFNGVIDMRTKDPYIHQGFSMSIKGGERNLFEGMFRYAQAFGRFAIKINGSYLRANDWQARNFDPYYESEDDQTNPGGYDAVNVYGDEFTSFGQDFTDPFARIQYPGLKRIYRTGYKEENVVDYNTENYKGNLGLFYKLKDDLRAEAVFSFGSGTTVYQGDNRYRLDGIFFWQGKLEISKPDKFFIRAYTTQEDAGKSYDAYNTALMLQTSAKKDGKWSSEYSNYWTRFITPRVKALEGYPSGIPFDFPQQEIVLQQNSDSLFAWHALAMAYANAQSQTPPGNARLEPGTPEFDAQFDKITGNISNDPDNPGTLFYDRSKLYHVHGEYKIESTFADFTVGANYRLYTPDTKGSIFSDTAGTTITNSEFGVYGGLSKRLIPAKLKLNATVRFDKNENFDLVVSPAASLVYTPDINNVFRLSYSSALRNPTLADQYLNLNVGRAQLIGNITGYDSLVTLESFADYIVGPYPDSLVYFNEPAIRPEQVQTIEVGYRGTLLDKLWIDFNYYFSWYQNFIGYKIAIANLQLASPLPLPQNFDIVRLAANAQSRVTTQGASLGANYYLGQYLTLTGNYSWNILNKKGSDDPIIPAFNTPEHKFNIGLSGRSMPLPLFNTTRRGFGFNITYKWIEGFLFEGSPQFTGEIPTYDLLDAQLNWHFEQWNTTLKIGASNVLNKKQFQTYGGPEIGRLAYISILYEYKR